MTPPATLQISIMIGTARRIRIDQDASLTNRLTGERLKVVARHSIAFRSSSAHQTLPRLRSWPIVHAFAEAVLVMPAHSPHLCPRREAFEELAHRL
jgi:hypothetical protein